MDSIERYNLARDREQHAFECSPLGDVTRRLRNHATVTGKHERVAAYVVTALAAEYALGARYPAFYAGRALALW